MQPLGEELSCARRHGPAKLAMTGVEPDISVGAQTAQIRPPAGGGGAQTGPMCDRIQLDRAAKVARHIVIQPQSSGCTGCVPWDQLMYPWPLA